jgi:Hemerythrin HHE cation binding domain
MATRMIATAENGLAQETDVVAFLIGQHMAIRDLFTEVALCDGGARAEAFERLVKLLAAHETAEQQIIRPMTRAGVDGGSDIADELIAEEAEAKELLVELERIGPADAEFPARLEQLRQAVLLHAHHEEANEFRYLKHKMDGGTMATTGMIKAAEAIAPTHPHPSINSATANTMAGPMVSMFDRTRDLVRKALGGD